MIDENLTNKNINNVVVKAAIARVCLYFQATINPV